MSNAVEKLHKDEIPAPVGNIHTALAAAQAEIKNPEKNKEANAGSYKYKYADIGDVLEAALPVLSKHGISVIQPTRIEDGQIILKTILTHGESDTSIESDYPVCSLNQDHRKMGGALTYARRYALCPMVGISPAEDLDGADAAKSGDGDRQKMSAAEAKKELNWNAIEDSIRTAKSADVLDKMEQRFQANKGVWPASFIASAFELSATRRNELEVQAKAASYDDIWTAFEDCATIDAVVHMTDALIQLGRDEAQVRETADLRKEALSALL